MFITLDHTELLAILEGAAYKTLADFTSNADIDKADENGKYNLGYTDGTTDLCENLKANVRKYVKEKEEKEEKAAELKKRTEPLNGGKDYKKTPSKYDN
jgi:hypothetical protein